MKIRCPNNNCREDYRGDNGFTVYGICRAIAALEFDTDGDSTFIDVELNDDPEFEADGDIECCSCSCKGSLDSFKKAYKDGLAPVCESCESVIWDADNEYTDCVNRTLCEECICEHSRGCSACDSRYKLGLYVPADKKGDNDETKAKEETQKLSEPVAAKRKTPQPSNDW